MLTPSVLARSSCFPSWFSLPAMSRQIASGAVCVVLVSAWWVTWDLAAMCLTVCLIQCSAGGTDGAAESCPQQRNGPDGEVHHSLYPDKSESNQATLILFLFVLS
ncbi:uncharacterized [Tachysurus ichikawai]